MKKTVVLGTLSDREINHVLKAAENSEVYPLTWFEKQVLDCMDASRHRVATTEGANRLMRLMKATTTVFYAAASSLDRRTLLVVRVCARYSRPLSSRLLLYEGFVAHIVALFGGKL